jgi:hypothetical protein
MGYSYAAISLTSTLKWSGSRPTGAAQGDPGEFLIIQMDPARDYGGYVVEDVGAFQQLTWAFVFQYVLDDRGPMRHM